MLIKVICGGPAKCCYLELYIKLQSSVKVILLIVNQIILPIEIVWGVLYVYEPKKLLNSLILLKEPHPYNCREALCAQYKILSKILKNQSVLQGAQTEVWQPDIQSKLGYQYGGGRLAGRQAPLEPEQRGPYLTKGKFSISKEVHQLNRWRPRVLPYRVGNHVIESMILPEDCRVIKEYCQQQLNKSLVFITRCPLTCVTTQDLQSLISHGEMINDNVMNVFLEILADQEDINYLSTHFMTKLRSEKSWVNLRRWFTPNYSQANSHKPHIQSPTILIPCHVRGCHWVAIVRRIIRGRVHFYYSDDMNHLPTEHALKNLLASYTDPAFYPNNTKWVSCHSTLYTPHSNECGPRTLFALLVMGLHPVPDDSILLPFMSSNLAQILRTWLASSIISGQVHIPQLIQSSNLEPAPQGQSTPYDIIQWHLDEHDPQAPKDPKKTEVLRRSNEPLPHAHKSIARNVKRVRPPVVSTNHGEEVKHGKKHGRWKKTKSKQKQTTIRRFIVTQPTLYDFNFLKPYGKPSTEDPDVWGHIMPSIDPAQTLRILVQNPNGIQPHISYSDFLFGLHVSETLGIGAICLPETNLNWQPSQISSLRKCFAKTWQHYSIQYSHSDEEFHSTYKPGGTLTAITNVWTSRVVEKGVDPYGLGRWSYITLQGKNRKIYIITVYRVCNNKDSGPKTAYRQQFRHLSRVFQTEKKLLIPDPYKQCIIDLQAWLEHLIAQSHSIILSLDSNEDITNTPPAFIPLSYQEGVHTVHRNHTGSLATLATTCGLIDPLAVHHKARPFPATYNRGSSRLDYILVSSSIMPAVQRSGILPYQSLFHSDHRPCYVDINPELLFGDPTKEMAPPCRRQLQLHDPDIVQKYTSTLQAQLEYHKIPKKLDALQQVISSGQWSHNHQREYEKIDRLITEAMLHAEKISSRKYTGTFSWSPELIQAVQTERFWKLLLKLSKGIPIADSTISRTRQAAGLPNVLEPVPTARIITELRAAKHTRKQFQSMHTQLRENYLDRLAKSLVLKASPQLQDPKNAERLRLRTREAVVRIIKKERKKLMYKNIGAVLGQNSMNKGGIARIDVPAPPSGVDPNTIDPKTWKGPWRAVTEPDEIGFYICQTNVRQYNQAQLTPFASGYLADLLGDVLTSYEAAHLLEGKLQVDESKVPLPETLTMLDFLGEPYSTTMSPSDGRITSSQFIDNYRNVQEKTSSSFSGRHVGHYKAVLDNPSLVAVHATMMSIPYQVGFSPSRWHEVVDVMLEKEAGNPKQHRLRIVALLESDYNQSQRILVARRLSHHMEDHGLIPEMQYGSRPSKMCVSPVLNKVISYDIVRQTKVNGAFIENDAIGCYDRLVNNLVFLELRRLGLPQSVLQCIQDTWNHARHHIKTKYGYSTCTYSNNEDIPLFGPGQGSTTGPTFWGVLFCLIVKNLPSNIGTMVFKAVDSALQVAHSGDAFVDDAQLGCTSELPSGHHDPTQLQTTREIVRSLQSLAQSWERLLFTTGGAINLQKSFWTLITWKWGKGVARLQNSTQAPEELKLTAGYATDSITVPRIEPHEGFRTLGVYISPSGSMSTSKKKLYDISMTYATAISGSSLNRSASLWSYLLYLLPKLTYPTPALTLTEAECQDILSPSLMAVLPRLHINRNTARSIVHGPAALGGMSLPTIFSEQSSGQLLYFTGHISLGDKTGKLLIISLSYLQLLSGSTHPILTQPFTKYSKWIENTWLNSLWAFLSKVGYSVTVSQQWLPVPPRKYDKGLMDQFIQLGFEPLQLGILNRCRLYLQVLYLSDLVSADGTIIIPAVKNGHRIIDRVSNLNWPIQDRPPPSAWTLWRQALAHFENRSKLLIPLRYWCAETHQRWRWFSEPTTRKIFYRADDSAWQKVQPYHPQYTGRQTRLASASVYDLRLMTPAQDIPTDLVPTTLNITRQRHKYISTAGPALTTTAPKVLPNYETSLLSKPIDHYLHQDLDTEFQELFVGVVSLCEGSQLAYGWSIYSQDELCADAGSVTGRFKAGVQTGFLAGLLAVLTLLQRISSCVGNLYIRVPGLQLLRDLTTKTPQGIAHMTCHDFDLVQAVKGSITTVEKFCKVHLFELEEDNAWNDALDKAKDSAMTQATRCQATPSSYAKALGLTSISKVLVERKGQAVAGNFRPVVREDLYYESLKETIIKREKWSGLIFPLIAWEAYAKAFQKLSRPRQLSYAKLSHCLLQTNHQNYRYYGTSSLCPGCKLHDETRQHVWSCPSPIIALERQDLLETYRATLEEFPTPNRLIDVIMHGINSWILVQQGNLRRQIAPTIADIRMSPVTAAYVEQTSRIGWDAFLRGRVGRAWGKAYASFFQDADVGEQERWLADLIRANLDLSLLLWKHRNAVVHGADQAAESLREKTSLLNKVVDEYRRYQSDPFMIPRNQSSLFESRTLHQRLQQDRDSLVCWLSDVALAKQTQIAHQDRAAQAAKRFFVPRTIQRKQDVTASSEVLMSVEFGDPLESDSTDSVSAGIYEDNDEASITTATYSFPECCDMTLRSP